jgi:hypothetical protein
LPAAAYSPGTMASGTAAQDLVWAVLERVAAAAVARAPPSAGPSVPPPPGLPQPQLSTAEAGTPSLVRSQASECEAGPIGIPSCDLTTAAPPSTFRGATSIAELQAQLRAWDLDSRYLAIGVSTVQCKSCAAALPTGTRTSGTKNATAGMSQTQFHVAPAKPGAFKKALDEHLSSAVHTERLVAAGGKVQTVLQFPVLATAPGHTARVQ